MITRLLNDRKVLSELVIAAILLAFSINLISSVILELKWVSPVLAFILASLLAASCTLYFVTRLLWTRTYARVFEGFIVCDSKRNEVVNVTRYDYARDLHSYLKSAFVENSAIKAMWDKEPVHGGFGADRATDKTTHTRGKGHQLIIEATEYYILENLSTHLTDYFNRPHFHDGKLHTLARNDIPDVLLSNRFLELFSKPMEDRPMFSADHDSPPVGGKVVMAMVIGGAFYSRFDLTLPKGARIKRTPSNDITIDTDRFSIIISVDFRGYGTVIPWEYEQHMLGITPHESKNYEIKVRFVVHFKFASLFLPGGWDYYRWAESFMDSFDDNFSRDRHFKKIGWESALTLIQYHQRQKVMSRGESQQVPSHERETRNGSHDGEA